jgi:hypothetical protein
VFPYFKWSVFLKSDEDLRHWRPEHITASIFIYCNQQYHYVSFIYSKVLRWNIIIIIIIIFGKTALFRATAFFRRFCQICLELDHPVFAYFNFATVTFTEQDHKPCVNTQPGGQSPCIYVPQWQGWPSCTGLPCRRLVRLAGLLWRFSNQPPRWMLSGNRPSK